MTLNANYLSKINMANLITIVDTDNIFQGLNTKEIEFVIDSFRHNTIREFPARNLTSALKLSINVHETRHFHDTLLTSFGIFRFTQYLQLYINFMIALLPSLNKANYEHLRKVNYDITKFKINDDIDTLIKLYQRTIERIRTVNSFEISKLSTTYFMENIASLVQCGYVENYSSYSYSLEIQKMQQINKNKPYYIPTNLLLLNDIVKSQKQGSKLLYIDSDKIIPILFDMLMFELPFKDGEFPLDRFSEAIAELSENSLGYEDVYYNFQKTKRDYNYIIDNNNKYIQTIYDKLTSTLASLSSDQQEVCMPIMDLFSSFIDSRNSLISQINIEDYNITKKYLKSYDKLPKNPVVFMSKKGLKINDEDIYDHLEINKKRLLHVFSFSNSKYSFFKDTWKYFFNYIVPLELFFQPNIQNDNPMIEQMLQLISDTHP